MLREAQLVIRAARETGAATHMFCASGLESTAELTEWIDAGAIGPVREVHNWSTRPYWPQGMTSLPTETVPVPEGLDWDLWLGPVPHRPYHPAYTNAVFRGWYDFGTGALGDMGHYSFFQIFKMLRLGSPLSVEASRSQYWKIDDLLWKKQANAVSYPQASLIRWEFPERQGLPPVALHWYDGGLRPPKPRELDEDGEPMPEEGLLLVGDGGKILAEFNGRNPRLDPEGQDAGVPAARRRRCRARSASSTSGCAPAAGSAPRTRASSASPRSPRRSCSARSRCAWTRSCAGTRRAGASSNAPEADALTTRTYRDGWAL